MKSVSYENKVVLGFIDFILFIVKWLALCLCVIYTALTIGLVVMNIIENSPEASTFFLSMVSSITTYSFNEASVVVNNIGKMHLLIGTIGLGVIFSLNYLLLYMISTRAIKLFKSFSIGDIYSKENLTLVDKIIAFALIYAFLLPIVKYFFMIFIGMPDFANSSSIGLIFIILAVIVKMLLESGYNIQVKLNRVTLELSDIKASEEEKNVENIKSEVKQKEEKKVNKNYKRKQTKKTTTK